jgi:hypothetical protein
MSTKDVNTMKIAPKIWRNGEFIDWKDARVHVMRHGQHRFGERSVLLFTARRCDAIDGDFELCDGRQPDFRFRFSGSDADAGNNADAKPESDAANAVRRSGRFAGNAGNCQFYFRQRRGFANRRRLSGKTFHAAD